MVMTIYLATCIVVKTLIELHRSSITKTEKTVGGNQRPGQCYARSPFQLEHIVDTLHICNQLSDTSCHILLLLHCELPWHYFT